VVYVLLKIANNSIFPLLIWVENS